MAGPGNSDFASLTNTSPSSAPSATSSERSSSPSPAAGLAMTAQAATRVTGFNAGKPPSMNTTSLQAQTRFTSIPELRFRSSQPMRQPLMRTSESKELQLLMQPLNLKFL